MKGDRIKLGESVRFLQVSMKEEIQTALKELQQKISDTDDESEIKQIIAQFVYHAHLNGWF
jgi:hypothetical protein